MDCSPCQFLGTDNANITHPMIRLNIVKTKLEQLRREQDIFSQLLEQQMKVLFTDRAQLFAHRFVTFPRGTISQGGCLTPLAIHPPNLSKLVSAMTNPKFPFTGLANVVSCGF